MGNRVALLKDGILQQADTPRHLYDRPGNAFVAGFIGSPAMNLRTAEVVPGGARLGNIVMPLSPETLAGIAKSEAKKITLGIRPESFKVAEVGTTGLAVTVNLVEELGADAFVYGTLKDDEPDDKKFVVRFDGRVPPRIGDILNVVPVAGEEHAFDIDSGERLG